MKAPRRSSIRNLILRRKFMPRHTQQNPTRNRTLRATPRRLIAAVAVGVDRTAVVVEAVTPVVADIIKIEDPPLVFDMKSLT